MITFVTALVLLIGGYFLYGSFVERVFRPQTDRQTPCYTHADGADYIPMPTWKVYTVQFLNIAGTGPIFGALMGILYGPAAFLWIVFGCILGGAMHDYMSGMISIRKNGASLPEIIGDELGSTARLVMRIVTLVLMICVGATFVMVPANLMAQLTQQLVGIEATNLVWVFVIFAFYLAVTVFSIDKIVGNIYPVFGFALLLMALLVGFGIFFHPGQIPEITDAFSNHYPIETTPLFPGMFVSIACGAVSGFHATQSPMMARCIKNEKYGLRCFYGAMVTEGVVTLIWAAAAIKFADAFDISNLAIAADFKADLATPYGRLLAILTNGGHGNMDPGLLVNVLCNDWLGTTGLVLAILGIVAAPMSTGGTAFRAARLIVADFTKFGQAKVWRRILLAAPLFVLAALMLAMKFDVLWRYVSWLNQVLATFTFFSIAMWLYERSKAPVAPGEDPYNGKTWLMAFFPAVFMLAVSSSFIMIAPEGFRLPHEVGYAIAAVLTVGFSTLFLWAKSRR
ncbi:MAG: carbon starvation CstA family protein [Bacteroidales bacterium]|nr:carbon starvation CstA family protein [Bacteroidales bacterium]